MQLAGKGYLHFDRAYDIKNSRSCQNQMHRLYLRYSEIFSNHLLVKLWN